jgi:hypothetical protein
VSALRAHWKVVLVGVVLLGAGIGVGAAANSGTKTEVERTYEDVTIFKGTSKVVTVTRYHLRARILKDGLKTAFGDGRYSVGEDISPGTYHAPGGHRCFWQRSADPAGMEVMANDYTNGEPVTMSVNPGEYIYTARCGRWHQR